MRPLPRIGVVVLAYGEEPHLESCISAVLASADVHVEVSLVDNGCTNPRLRALGDRDGVTLVQPSRNLGFTGGCNRGSRETSAPLISLINSDCIVHERALAELAVVATRREVGIASACIRLADHPESINSAGNPVHFTGLSWSGRFGEPAKSHQIERDVAAASGATMMLRREVWEELGGFPEKFFAYAEDTELSLRCRQLGYVVRFVPIAVAFHHYEFARHPSKLELLERNRLLVLLTLYERRTLAILAPALLLFELAMLLTAASGGWLRQKLAGWRWIVANARWVRQRRACVQGRRRMPDQWVLAAVTGRITAANVPAPRGFWLVDALLATYWTFVRDRIVDTEDGRA